jgi:hypothetical protein
MIGLNLAAISQQSQGHCLHPRARPQEPMLGAAEKQFGTVHAATEPGTIAAFEPLRMWVVLLLVIASLSWLYRIFHLQDPGVLCMYFMLFGDSGPTTYPCARTRGRLFLYQERVMLNRSNLQETGVSLPLRLIVQARCFRTI